jgi:hypothetical protein
MIRKSKLALLAVIAALTIGAPAAALAQSAYTTGSAAGNVAAGYPSPYGSGGGLYAYAPNYGYSHNAWSRRSRPGRFGRE